MACRHAETGPSGPRAGQPFPAPVTAVSADLGSSTGITLRRAQVVAQGSEQWQAAVDVEATHQSDSADFTVNEIVAMGRSPHKHLIDRESTSDRRIIGHALERVGMAPAAELVSGPRNVDAAEELGKYLRSIGR
jgi:iron complex transport system ATP-binding protein